MSPRTSLARVALVWVFLTAALAVGAAPRPAANIDLVVLVDTSESMFPYFDDLMTYLVQDLLTTRLHKGDTFHLLSFSSTPEVEIALAVNSDEAARQAFSRVLLLHALGRYTDLVAAMQYLYTYVKDLPETNAKHLIIITDGVHDPPPGSPNKLDEQTIRGLVTGTAQSMRREGWEVTILKVPPVPAPEDQGEKSYLADIAQAVGVPVIPYPTQNKQSVTGVTTGYPTLIFPAVLGQVGNRFDAPFRVKNWKNEPLLLTLSSVQSEGTELLDHKVSATIPASAEVAFPVPLRLPVSYPKGSHSTQVTLVFDDDPRISPTDGTLAFTYTGKGGFPFPRLTLLYGLYIVLGLALLYLLVRLFLFMRKKLAEAPLTGLGRADALAEAGEQPGARAAASAGAHAAGAGPAAAARGAAARSAAPPRRGPPRKATVSLLAPPSAPSGGRHRVALLNVGAPAAGGKQVRPTVQSIRRALPAEPRQGLLPPMVEMRVEDQNHRVGFRNVHRIAPGASRSVGGRSSGFLIFLSPMPANIAEIRNVDGTFVFTPVRTECFPDVSGPVQDCLGKAIPFVSPKGRQHVLHFREWVSPLEEVNRIMRQARSPGY
ncbi:MAG TPA: vWA domain-containing protein [Spirochaetia bacterium]|nr:vWA domain-containing protein [Spirochaetia bacterium]